MSIRPSSQSWAVQMIQHEHEKQATEAVRKSLTVVSRLNNELSFLLTCVSASRKLLGAALFVNLHLRRLFQETKGTFLTLLLVSSQGLLHFNASHFSEKFGKQIDMSFGCVYLSAPAVSICRLWVQVQSIFWRAISTCHMKPISLTE